MLPQTCRSPDSLSLVTDPPYFIKVYNNVEGLNIYIYMFKETIAASSAKDYHVNVHEKQEKNLMSSCLSKPAWGNSQRLSNSDRISYNLSSLGTLTYFERKCCDIVWHVLWTIVHTVESTTPNRTDIVQYSEFVANLHKVIATCSSTVISIHIYVTFFPSKSEHGKPKIY